MGNKEPQFLPNTPIGEDLFEGKSQEKTAITLCNILERKDFQIIGIDGGWGTGKSNLVKIIEAKLKSKSFHFFIYDVWGHQEDEQRRAILEELTEKICDDDNNIVSNKSKWKQKLSKLLAKEREITTINRPYLGIGVIFTLFSIIYVPTVNVFTKDLQDSYFKLNLGSFWWKVVIVGFPLVLVSVTFFWHLIEQLCSKKKWQSFKIAIQKTFQVYNNKQIDETKIETISESEPSVKDFRKWMKEIDIDLNNKKLVLVFDNFDRLPKNNILSLWSSIHVFFAEEKYANIKVIIPFDRQHIQNAFKDLNTNTSVTSTKRVKDNYSDDYINKTFDIVYRVSPPILSNWKSYFKDRWIKAFGNTDNDEYERVEELYEIFNETITPREIIVFINEIVSLKLLFNEKIPDQYFALFILNKDKLLLNSLKEISEPSYLSGASYLYKSDEDLAKYITAIIYQIDPENAIEVIYSKQLKNALVNKDFEKFKNISKSSFLSSTIDGILTEINNIEFPIETLDTLDKDTGLSEYKLKLVWQKLYDKALGYTYHEFELPPYQKILLKNVDLSKSRNWVKFILDSLYQNDKFNAEKFSNIIDEIDSYLKENTIGLNIFEFLKTKKENIDLFIPFISQKNESYINYKINCDKNELNDFLSKLSIEKLDKAEYVKFLKEHYDLTDFNVELTRKIEEQKADAANLSILYRRLKDIEKQTLPPLLPDSTIYTLFRESSESIDFYYDLFAMRISRLNDFNSSYSSVFSTILNSDRDDIACKIAEVIEYYIDYDKLLIGCEYFTDSPLYKLICKKVISNNYGDSNANLQDLLLKFEVIQIQTGIDPQIFLNDLDRWKYEDINSSEALKFPNILYTEARNNDTNLAKAIVNNALEYFRNLDKDQWVGIFSQLGSKDFKLLKIISFNEWNSHSSEAFKESVIKIVLSGKLTNKEELEYIFESFEEGGIQLINTFKDVRDKFYSNRDLMNKDFFTFFIKYFIRLDALADKPGDAFRTIFKSEFLDDEELVNVMCENSDTIKALIKSSVASEVSDFKHGIIDRQETSNLIKELAEKLGIRMNKK